MLTDSQIIKAMNEDTAWIEHMFVAALAYKTLIEITEGDFYGYERMEWGILRDDK